MTNDMLSTKLDQTAKVQYLSTIQPEEATLQQQTQYLHEVAILEKTIPNPHYTLPVQQQSIAIEQPPSDKTTAEQSTSKSSQIKAVKLSGMVSSSLPTMTPPVKPTVFTRKRQILTEQLDTRYEQT